ncbi:LacI family DNA-binding transcriptional regulator [Labrys wisconsinensis]|uniref:DNA-binding LacI/PurR family transcriptional regulator n=1 Tax=Labrys wisconsinensis TaxID=425677 RepID=A0ABU0JKT8_9HYPH|nr:LacI family DNA-binding transcriptional regulator [Labrys wisconsinensis]MDQ0473879.1 DNA-binding LacI/PurR family transcriptional regulator [Labrys wisconsinensis]
MGMGGKKYASSTDVARLAGVSQSAVSRTYRPGASVSEETRRKVMAAAAELDYRPSLIPRIMLTHRSNLVAIVIGGMYNPFYSAVLEGFTVKLQESGHQVLLVHVDSGHSLDAVIPKLASYRVDAIVSALAILSPQSAEELARFKIPVISFNTPVKNEWVSSVCCDNAGSARILADLFLARGGRRFGYISGPPASPANLERFAGFREGLAAHGITDIATATADFRYEGGFRAALEMFARPERPDAVFCANDLVAIGAIDALRQQIGLRVPEDVLIAGFDDIPSASWAGYDLTTFVHDGPRMVDEALSILRAAETAHAPVGEVRVVVPARLVERGTTRR